MKERGFMWVSYVNNQSSHLRGSVATPFSSDEEELGSWNFDLVGHCVECLSRARGMEAFLKLPEHYDFEKDLRQADCHQLRGSYRLLKIGRWR